MIEKELALRRAKDITRAELEQLPVLSPNEAWPYLNCDATDYVRLPTNKINVEGEGWQAVA